jgi:hypothetical protein
MYFLTTLVMATSFIYMRLLRKPIT